MEPFFGFAKTLLDQGLACVEGSYDSLGLYDVLNEGAEDVGFYVQFAASASGPVLDVACGSGRVLLPLKEAGIPCSGVDNAAAMLAAAEKKLAVRGWNDVELYCQDMTDLQIPQVFAGVIVPYRSMMYLLDNEQRLLALESFYRHLRPGGLLAFDFDSASPTAGRQQPYLALQGIHPLCGAIMLQVVEVWGFEDGRRLLNQVNYTLGETTAITVQSVWEASCSADVMAELVRAAGFVDAICFGHFDRRPYTGGDWCVLTAKKPGE